MGRKRGYTARVPSTDMNAHLQSYQAQPLPEYSNAHRHVYFSASMNKYITVRKPKNSGVNVEFEFTAACPCTYED